MMTVVCPKCGAVVQSGQRFCVKCGAALTASSGAGKEPKLDLSSYFDDKAPERGAAPRRDMDEIFAFDPDRRHSGAGAAPAQPAAAKQPAQSAAQPRPAQPEAPRQPTQNVPRQSARPGQTAPQQTARPGQTAPQQSARPGQTAPQQTARPLTPPAQPAAKAQSAARPAQPVTAPQRAVQAAPNAKPRPAAAPRPSDPALNSKPKAPAKSADPTLPQAAGKRKSSRALDIALMILSVLAIGVVTFVLILLFWPSGDGGRDRTPSAPIATYEPAPATETEGPTFIIEDPDASPADPGTAPAVVPTILPTTVPTAVPTPAPTADPASAYLLPDSDSRYLTEEDLKGLTHEQLCFARNEIFARHGRIFKTQQIADYFNGKSWYRGTVSAEAFQDSVFNAYERANITLISNYEKKMYGGSYY